MSSPSTPKETPDDPVSSFSSSASSSKDADPNDQPPFSSSASSSNDNNVNPNNQTPYSSTVIAALRSLMKTSTSTWVKTRNQTRETYTWFRQLWMLRRIAQTKLGTQLLKDRGIDLKILLGTDVNIARKELEAHGIRDISARTLQTRTKINISTQQHWMIAQENIGVSDANIFSKDPIRSTNELITWRDAIDAVVPDDMPTLLKQLKDQSQIIEKLAPAIQQEYGVSQQNTLALVHGVQLALSGTDTKNITAAAASIVRFDTQLNYAGNITTEQLLKTSDETPAMKDYMENIAQKGDTPLRQEPTETTNQFLTRTAAKASAQERRIFEEGSIVDQAKVLQSILETQRVQKMLQELKDKNEFDLVTDFDALMTDLNNIGEPNAQSICRRSVPEASACVVGYLHRLEDASRTTFFARLVGSLQDLLHIGS